MNCETSCSTCAPMIRVMTLVNSADRARQHLEVGLAAGLGRGEQDADHAAVEEGRQPLGGVEEVQRRAGRRGVDDDEVVVAGGLELAELLHRHVLLRAGEGGRERLVEGVRQDRLGLGRARRGSRTISSNVRFMSSIIASSEPPVAVSTPSTRRGVLSSSVRPIDCASRRAGSMVSTTVRRPRSAARSASDAAVVVLPTPPEPVQTRILRGVEDGVDVEHGRARCAGSCHALRLAAGRPARRAPTGRRRRAAAAARTSAGRARRARRGRAPRARPGWRGRPPRRAARSTRASGASSPAFSSPATTAARSSVPCSASRRASGDSSGGAHGVDDRRRRPAGRRTRSSVDAVDRLLHGHLLQQRHEVHRGLRRAEDRHDAVGLGLDRADLGQAADLGADVEEPRDAAGRRRVEHDGVVDVRSGRARGPVVPPPVRTTASLTLPVSSTSRRPGAMVVANSMAPMRRSARAPTPVGDSL